MHRIECKRLGLMDELADMTDEKYVAIKSGIPKKEGQLMDPIELLTEKNPQVMACVAATLKACKVQLPVKLYASGRGHMPNRGCLSNCIRATLAFKSFDGTHRFKPVAGFQVYPILTRWPGTTTTPFVGLKLVGHVVLQNVATGQLFDITESDQSESVPFIRSPENDGVLQMIAAHPPFLAALETRMFMSCGLMVAPGQCKELNDEFQRYVALARKTYRDGPRSVLPPSAIAPVVQDIADVPFLWCLTDKGAEKLTIKTASSLLLM